MACLSRTTQCTNPKGSPTQQLGRRRSIYQKNANFIIQCGRLMGGTQHGPYAHKGDRKLLLMLSQLKKKQTIGRLAFAMGGWNLLEHEQNRIWRLHNNFQTRSLFERPELPFFFQCPKRREMVTLFTHTHTRAYMCLRAVAIRERSRRGDELSFKWNEAYSKLNPPPFFPPSPNNKTKTRTKKPPALKLVE